MTCATTNSLTPLRYPGYVDSDPPLKRFITQTIMLKHSPADTECAVVARRILQACAILVAGAAQGGMVKMSLAASGGNSALGTVLVASNLSTFGSFYAYCSWMILNDSFKVLSEEGKKLFHSEIPGWVRNSLKICAAVTGAFSQIPMAYAAYAANNNNPIFAISRFLDAGLPIRSLYLGAKSLFTNINLTEVERKLESSRNEFISLIKQKQSTLLKCTAESQQLLGRLETLHSGRMEEYLQALISLPNALIQESGFVSASKKAALVAGHFSNLLVMALYGIITFHAMSLISDDKNLNIAAALLVIACKFYLWKDSVTQAARQFPSDVLRLLGNETQPTISQVFMPKTDAIATALAYVIGGFSCGSMKYFCDLYELGDGGTAVTSIATALLAKSTFSALKNGLVEEGLSRWGTEEAKRLISFFRELEKLSVTLRDTYRPELAKFLLLLPEELKLHLCKEGLTDLEIRQYLQTKTFRSDSMKELDQFGGDVEQRLLDGTTDSYGSTLSSIHIEEVP